MNFLTVFFLRKLLEFFHQRLKIFTFHSRSIPNPRQLKSRRTNYKHDIKIMFPLKKFICDNKKWRRYHNKITMIAYTCFYYTRNKNHNKMDLFCYFCILYFYVISFFISGAHKFMNVVKLNHFSSFGSDLFGWVSSACGSQVE